MSGVPYSYSERKGILPVSWEDFHGLCKALAAAASRFKPQLILPIGRGGYYPGTLIAHMLRLEPYPIRISRRKNDEVSYDSPRWIVEPPREAAGLRTMIVDEICDTGETLLMVKERLEGMGAFVKSAVLYSHRRNADVPDFIGLVTDELILNPWDREIFSEGRFQFHPEYVEALRLQGRQADGSLLVPATPFELAKG